jgi:hypothetical protein
MWRTIQAHADTYKPGWTLIQNTKTLASGLVYESGTEYTGFSVMYVPFMKGLNREDNGYYTDAAGYVYVPVTEFAAKNITPSVHKTFFRRGTDKMRVIRIMDTGYYDHYGTYEFLVERVQADAE